MADLSELPFAKDIRRDYSGRGMFGRETVAVVIDRDDEGQARAWIAQHYPGRVAWDDMGRDGRIVYDPQAPSPGSLGG
jgi:hypothetical protein